MGSLILTSSAAFFASLFLTAIVRQIARRWGIVDRPDGNRKLHGSPKPLLGGVAVYVAMVFAFCVARLLTFTASPQLDELFVAWVISAASVCFVGSIDDLYNLHSRFKLTLQIVSVLPIILLGYQVDRVVAFGYPLELGWFGIPLTVFWLIGCINALNLIDGMDGLASIVGLSAATMLGAIAASEGHDHVAVLAIILAGAVAGFLVFNLPPASIFLGDSGSMVIGLTVGVLGIQGSMKTSATLAVTAPAVVMALPIFDTLAALVRRKLTGRRFDSPDRLHIHHRLLNRGWTPWQVLCLIGVFCLTTGAAATAATLCRRDALAWITAISLVVALIRLRLFGYEEYDLAKEAFRHRVMSFGNALRRRHVAGDLGLAAIESLSCTESWDLLIHDVRQWRISQVELTCSGDHRSRGIRWFDPAMPPNANCHWSLAVSLPSEFGDLCELRVAAISALTSEADVASLTSLLKTFGTHFAMHADQLLGPATEPSSPEKRQLAA